MSRLLASCAMIWLAVSPVATANAQPVCDVESICKAQCPGQLHCYVRPSCKAECLQHIAPEQSKPLTTSDDGERFGLVLKGLRKPEAEKVLEVIGSGAKP